jgi:hypothetical protein
VLELVEGETLADQIARGPIPVDDALKVALQICEGLEASPLWAFKVQLSELVEIAWPCKMGRRHE